MPILSQSWHLKIRVSFFSLFGKIPRTRSSTAHCVKISPTKPEQWQETMWSLNTFQTVSVIHVISVVMCWLPKAIYGFTDQGSIWTKSKIIILLIKETFSYWYLNFPESLKTHCFNLINFRKQWKKQPGKIHLTGFYWFSMFSVWKDK